MRTSRISCLALLAVAACGQPPRGPCAPGVLGTVCGFENPEDVEYVEGADVVLVTNLRVPRRPTGGFLSALTPGATSPRRVWPTGAATDVAPDPTLGDPACPGPPPPAAFAPHGATSKTREGVPHVWIVNHPAGDGGREAVEIFAVDGRGDEAAVSWKGCIPQEAGVMANDVAVATSGDVVVSNYQPSPSVWHSIKGAGLGLTTGDVLTWQRGRGWQHVAETAAALPNGVAVSADGTMLFYAETGTGRVHRLPLAGGPRSGWAYVGGNPDNLSWTPRGTLLVATHTGGTSFLLCGLALRIPCRTPWEVHEIDPQTLAATRVFAHDGRDLGAVASAVEVGGRLYLGSVFDDRIGVAAR
jgi:hypothetical protein